MTLSPSRILSVPGIKFPKSGHRPALSDHTVRKGIQIVPHPPQNGTAQRCWNYVVCKYNVRRQSTHEGALPGHVCCLCWGLMWFGCFLNQQRKQSCWLPFFGGFEVGWLLNLVLGYLVYIIQNCLNVYRQTSANSCWSTSAPAMSVCRSWKGKTITKLRKRWRYF